MWIKTTTHQVIANEPQLGTQTETELIEQEGEALDIILRRYIDDCVLPSYVTTLDDNTDQEIEIDVTDYLTPTQIELLDDLADMEFSLEIVYKILECVR